MNQKRENWGNTLADVFEMDAAKLFDVGAAMDRIGQSSVKTSAQIQEVQEALTMLADAKQKLQTGEFTIIDPDTVVGMQRVEESMKRAGINLGFINKQQKEWNAQTGKTIINYDDLTRRERKLAKLQMDKLKTSKEYVRTEQGLVQIGDRKQINASKTLKAFENQGKKLWSMAKSMASVDVSLVGIIALLIEAYNISTKVAALSRRTASSWGMGSDNIAKANATIWRLHTGFRKSVDEAGAFTESLARSGVSLEDISDKTTDIVSQQKLNAGLTILNLGGIKQSSAIYKSALDSVRKMSTSKRTEYRIGTLLMANDEKRLISAADMNKSINALVNNFGVGQMEAYGFLGTVRDSAIELKKTGAAISIEEVVSDWSELIDKTKSYNTDLLGTLALYNTLINKDTAKKLGLGDAPMAVRREIAKTIAGFSNELEDGWKAALGEGASAAARILNFEDLLPEDQFVKMASFINKHIGGSTEQAQYRARMLLKQMGFASTEARKFMAKSFVGGKFTVQGLEEVKKTIKEQREAAVKLQEKEKADRQSLVASAKGIAVGLQSLQAFITQWIQDNVVGILKDLISAIKELKDAIGDLFSGDPSRKLRREQNIAIPKMATSTIEKKLNVTGIPQEFIRELGKTEAAQAESKRFLRASGITNPTEGALEQPAVRAGGAQLLIDRADIIALQTKDPEVKAMYEQAREILKKAIVSHSAAGLKEAATLYAKIVEDRDRQARVSGGGSSQSPGSYVVQTGVPEVTPK